MCYTCADTVRYGVPTLTRVVTLAERGALARLEVSQNTIKSRRSRCVSQAQNAAELVYDPVDDWGRGSPSPRHILRLDLDSWRRLDRQ